ncbi:unnamed protein product [Parnassius mnemosyne]|uniref:Armadillo repeat-containing protein 8 n=1 Tax=Parnassius mnemosyne TaxID=213953 RepID=A0AAV1K9V5_9NEOP
MDDFPVHSLRESTRNVLKLNRRFHRDEVSDVQRSIKELSISPQSVADAVQKLKTKCLITITDLQTLKNGLMEDSKNIEVVLSTHGALRGLVRELSGHDIRKQCAAAGCCCNLALGDARACMAIAKAAGPYLNAALDNLTTELAVTCAWALGNLAGSGAKVCDILVAQGALAKLCELLLLNNADVQDAALYALLHFAFHMEDDFKTEYLPKVLSALSKLEANLTSSQLSFVLSCHADFRDNMPEEFLQKMLATLALSVKNHTANCKENNLCCELVYVIRTLANMDIEMYGAILNFLLENNLGQSLWQILNLNNSVVNESLLWLLGNLHNCCGDNIFFSNL